MARTDETSAGHDADGQRHFMAVGDADDDVIEHRLYNCETIYAIFFDHFRKKGFTVRPPAGRMMVAAFDSQEGFEAYLGRRMSTAITGIYDPVSNRLVIYDYARNRAFQAGEEVGRRHCQKDQIAVGPTAFRRRLWPRRSGIP